MQQPEAHELPLEGEMRPELRPPHRQNARTVIMVRAFLLVDIVVRGGVEPPTFRFSGGRSYQLSYLTVPGSLPLPGLSGPDGI